METFEFEVEREQWIKEKGIVKIEANSQEEALLLYSKFSDEYEPEWNEDLLESEFGDIVIIEKQGLEAQVLDTSLLIKYGNVENYEKHK